MQAFYGEPTTYTYSDHGLDDLTRGARQQQKLARHVSCQGCRVRKMKCSRTFPCTTCRIRNEDCIWLDAIPSKPNDDMELEQQTREVIRLRKLCDHLLYRLEESESKLAVFEGRPPNPLQPFNIAQDAFSSSSLNGDDIQVNGGSSQLALGSYDNAPAMSRSGSYTSNDSLSPAITPQLQLGNGQISNGLTGAASTNPSPLQGGFPSTMAPMMVPIGYPAAVANPFFPQPGAFTTLQVPGRNQASASRKSYSQPLVPSKRPLSHAERYDAALASLSHQERMNLGLFGLPSVPPAGLPGPSNGIASSSMPNGMNGAHATSSNEGLSGHGSSQPTSPAPLGDILITPTTPMELDYRSLAPNSSVRTNLTPVPQASATVTGTSTGDSVHSTQDSSQWTSSLLG